LALAAPAHAIGCGEAAALAEARFAIPDGLLRSIARVESGGATRDGWPWAVGANGTGRFYASPDEAAAGVASLRADGTRLIDVGCFQVDLFWHPDAFRTIREAFDPVANAMAAGAFLSQLHMQDGDWSRAVADYHSHDPLLGARYKDAVYRVPGGRPSDMGTGADDPFVVSLSAWQPAAPRHLPHIIRGRMP